MFHSQFPAQLLDHVAQAVYLISAPLDFDVHLFPLERGHGGHALDVPQVVEHLWWP
jgi:hypothetical protein